MLVEQGSTYRPEVLITFSKNLFCIIIICKTNNFFVLLPLCDACYRSSYVHTPTQAFKDLQTGLAAQSKGSTLTNSVPGYLQVTTQEPPHQQGSAYPEQTSSLAFNSLSIGYVSFSISLSFQWTG